MHDVQASGLQGLTWGVHFHALGLSQVDGLSAKLAEYMLITAQENVIPLSTLAPNYDHIRRIVQIQMKSSTTYAHHQPVPRTTADTEVLGRTVPSAACQRIR